MKPMERKNNRIAHALLSAILILSFMSNIAFINMRNQAMAQDGMNPEAEKNYEEAFEARLKGDYASALEHIDKAILIDPTADYLNEKAQILGLMADINGAILALIESIKIDADRYATYRELWERYLEAGDADKAIDTAQKSTKTTDAILSNVSKMWIAQAMSKAFRMKAEKTGLKKYEILSDAYQSVYDSLANINSEKTIVVKEGNTNRILIIVLIVYVALLTLVCIIQFVVIKRRNDRGQADQTVCNRDGPCLPAIPE
jgi:tetratricopeptide (TPR) repeat protein